MIQDNRSTVECLQTPWPYKFAVLGRLGLPAAAAPTWACGLSKADTKSSEWEEFVLQGKSQGPTEKDLLFLGKCEQAKQTEAQKAGPQLSQAGLGTWHSSQP